MMVTSYFPFLKNKAFQLGVHHCLTGYLVFLVSGYYRYEAPKWKCLLVYTLTCICIHKQIVKKHKLGGFKGLRNSMHCYEKKIWNAKYHNQYILKNYHAFLDILCLKLLSGNYKESRVSRDQEFKKWRVNLLCYIGKK